MDGSRLGAGPYRVDDDDFISAPDVVEQVYVGRGEVDCLDIGHLLPENPDDVYPDPVVSPEEVAYPYDRVTQPRFLSSRLIMFPPLSYISTAMGIWPGRLWVAHAKHGS